MQLDRDTGRPEGVQLASDGEDRPRDPLDLDGRRRERLAAERPGGLVRVGDRGDDERARDVPDDRMDELGVRASEQERELAAARDAEDDDAVGIDLVPPAQPLESRPEVLERDPEELRGQAFLGEVRELEHVVAVPGEDRRLELGCEAAVRAAEEQDRRATRAVGGLPPAAAEAGRRPTRARVISTASGRANRRALVTAASSASLAVTASSNGGAAESSSGAPAGGRSCESR